jgi:HAD superfamily hydrolase (TIGR01490 family)
VPIQRRHGASSVGAWIWNQSSRATSGQASLPLVTREAAFFDLDRTLMAGSSGMHFARAAFRTGMVSRSLLAKWGVEHLRFRLRGSTDERTAQVLSQVKDLLAGVPERHIERMAPELLAGVLPRIYPQMLEEVRAHQDAGRATFIVSAAGNGLVEILAQVLAMDGGIGTRYEVGEGGLLTGRIVEPFVYGAGKVQAMEDFAARHGIELADSWAYSDSASDLPMLRAVGNPVAVNPDPELGAVAAAEGWRVMRFEKLGRRLAIAGATVVAAAVGGMGTLFASRRRQPRGVRPALRRR